MEEGKRILQACWKIFAAELKAKSKEQNDKLVSWRKRMIYDNTNTGIG